MSAQAAPGRKKAGPLGSAVPGGREARWSLRMLWWVPASPFVGFALAGRLLSLGAEEPLWKAILLGVVLMTPFAVGAYFGLHAVRQGNRRGWIGLGANLLLALIAVVMPIREGLTGGAT